jgi:hypothetical protein
MWAMVLPGLLLLPAGSRTIRRRVLWLMAGILVLGALSFAGCGSYKSSPYLVTIQAMAPDGTTGATSFAVDVYN